MARTRRTEGAILRAISTEVEWIAKADVATAAKTVMALANTIDAARTTVVDAKAEFIQRASEDGYTVRRIAELMNVSPCYVQRLKQR